MIYKKAKIYSDGNAYIAIPRNTNPLTRRRAPREDDVVYVAKEICVDDNGVIVELPKGSNLNKNENNDKISTSIAYEAKSSLKIVKIEVPVPRKKIFENLNNECDGFLFRERREYVLERMKGYFDSYDQAIAYVDEMYSKARRNLIYRRKRMVRKAYLHGSWNYFCTFTYDDDIVSGEESFKKKLSDFLKHNVNRKGWKYIGVWERGSINDRLHFHGIFDIPEGALPGDIEEVEDYDYKTHRKRITHSCIPVRNKLGRNDFENINENDLSRSLGYLMKYLEKSGEKILYSRGLPEYRICDIQDEDVLAPMNKYEDKLLLFDDFVLINNGNIIGPCTLNNLRLLPSSVD
ncbi:MAG: hypothetical protein IJF11_02170 [Clostridia bacterium]|nr:hypothetical protein [Clostridia bacterium]